MPLKTFVRIHSFIFPVDVMLFGEPNASRRTSTNILLINNKHAKVTKCILSSGKAVGILAYKWRLQLMYRGIVELFRMVFFVEVS